MLTDPKLRDRYDRARFFAGSKTRANSFTSTAAPSDRKTPPQPNSFFSPPAAKCMFSDYYFDDYREKLLLQTFREAAEAACDAWKLADVRMREAESTGMAASWGPDYSYYRQERERKRLQSEDLRWKMDSAEAALRQHKYRAQVLLKQVKKARARTKKADAAASRVARHATKVERQKRRAERQTRRAERPWGAS